MLPGEIDMRFPLNVAEELHTNILGSTLVLVPSVPHLSDREAPDRFHIEIHGFLHAIGA